MVVSTSLIVIAPACDDNRQCASSIDCLAEAPTCDTTRNVCVEGPSQCRGDDANDDGDTDDGPSVATVLTTPTAQGAPTIVDGAICSEPASEQDWYRIGFVQGVRISPFGLIPMDLEVSDASGTRVGISTDGPFTNGRPRSVTLTSAPEGTYYARISRHGTLDSHFEALPYTITVTTQPVN